MALVVEATTEGGVGVSSSSFTATAPSTVNADDLLILTVATDSSEPVREATTTDWTLLSLFNSKTTSRGGLHVFYHWADGTEDSETWTFNLTDVATETAAWEMMRISGADTSTNPEASGSDGPFFHMPIGDASRVTTPDHADFDPPATTAAFDVRAEFIAWNQVGQRTLLSQWPGATNRGFVLCVGADAWNRVRLYWSSSGSDLLAANTTTTFSAATGDRVQIRAVLVADNGSSQYTVDFYEKVNSSDDLTSDTGWTAIGTQIVGGATTTINNSTANVEVGRYTAGTSDQFKVEAHQVAYKAAGTTKMWADFRSGIWKPSGVDAQGHTWTPQTRADHPVWQATSTEVEGNPDPPSVTASWGSDDNLFIAATGVDAVATTSDITAAPSGYSGFAEINSDTLGGSGPAIAAIAWEVFASATQDPGVFTLTGTGGSGYSATTIVVRPLNTGAPQHKDFKTGSKDTASSTLNVVWSDTTAAAGDLLIVHIVGDQADGIVTDPSGIPSGWTLAYNEAIGGAYSASLSWKVATASDISTGNATWSFDGTAQDFGYSVDVIEAGTFNATTPFDDSDFAEDIVPNGSVTVTSTPTGTDRLILYLAGADGDVAGELFSSSRGDELYDVTDLTGDLLHVGCYRYYPPSAAGYSATVTNSTANEVHVFAVALSPFTASAFTVSIDGDGTISSVYDETHATTDLYLSIDDDPDSPTTTDWITSGETDGSSFHLLGAVPADFGSIISLSVKAYIEAASFDASTCTLYAQVFAANETTNYTDEVSVATKATSGLVTIPFTVNATGLAATKAEWDAARIRFRWDYTE